mmetsp:Transcript_25487/g.83907  ORF Transcript_25487/g.83907 Transcript_25487/m.83907 type:complete len:499 (+) Transcript_25487:161-1657(+)
MAASRGDADGRQIDTEDGEQQQEQQQRTVPRWFTPTRMLVLFCIINFIVYLDRGVIASNGVNGHAANPDKGIKPEGVIGAFDLSYFEDGALQSAFMVGLLVGSPTFAELSKYRSAFRLLGVGLAAWMLSTASCGAAVSFPMLLTSRMFVGLGEASFCSLAAPFIDDYAPPNLKSTWLAGFYAMIPVGVACGFIYGGVIGSQLGWRFAFWLEAAAMVPFTAFCFVAKPVPLGGSTGGTSTTHLSSGEDAGSWEYTREFFKDIRIVLGSQVFALAAFGYSMYCAVIGVYGFFGPQAGKDIFDMQEADYVFGAITVVTGIGGTFMGGRVLDACGSTIANGMLVSSVFAAAGFALLTVAFQLQSLTGFIIMFGLGECMIFALQAPVVAVAMWCVPTRLRAVSMGVITVLIHVCGDVPSPILTGYLKDRLDHVHDDDAGNWRIALSIVTGLLAIATIAFGAAAYVGRFAPDYRNELKDAQAAPNPPDLSTVNSPEEPLLTSQG